MGSLQDRVIIVVGATGGMGRAITSMLAQEGAKLALIGRDRAALDEVVAELGDVAVMTALADVTDEAQVEAAFAKIKETYSYADALINLPGLSIAARIDAMPLSDFDLIMDANIKSAFLVSKYFVPLVDENRHAQVLFASSMAARRANPNAPVYCAAKAALTMFAEGFALQAMDHNIRVTGLRPGPTDTDGFWGDRPVPREKFLKASDIADVVRFILTLPSHVVIHEIAFESFTFFKK